MTATVGCRPDCGGAMLAFHTLDVFTDTPFAGNPLAVVLGADDLTTAQMQTIAREFNLSETIFVQRPVNPIHTARVRLFSPTAGIPEDPATGSASAILAAQLWGAGAVGTGETRLDLLQGVEMGRRSEIGLTVICGAAGVKSVRVSGTAVLISEGRIRIPD